MSYVRHYYHIVFTPKNRAPIIHENIKRKIYKLIYQQIIKYDGYVHRINGMPDHIHILASLPAKYAVADIIKIIKQEVSKEIIKKWLIPEWEKWEEGYSSFTFSYRELEMMKNYVINQEEHHKNFSFTDEYKIWLIQNGIDSNDPYFPR